MIAIELTRAQERKLTRVIRLTEGQEKSVSIADVYRFAKHALNLGIASLVNDAAMVENQSKD